MITETSPEPRWPAVVTVLAAVGLHFALPSTLRFGPPWLGAGVVVLLVALGLWASHTHRLRLNQIVGYLLAVALTIGLLFGVVRLIFGVVGHRESAAILLRSAAILWFSNVVTFAVWYWRLDGGGPHERARRHHSSTAAFLFPQMLMASGADAGASEISWRPHFTDYLFLSFNTSTAFSPTDVPVLGRWAKMLTMVQALIAFTTIVVLVARAINTL